MIIAVVLHAAADSISDRPGPFLLRVEKTAIDLIQLGVYATWSEIAFCWMKVRNGKVIQQICCAMWDLGPGKLHKEVTERNRLSQRTKPPWPKALVARDRSMAAEVSSVENMPRGQYPVTMKDSHKWPSVYDFSLWLLLDSIGSNGIFLGILEYIRCACSFLHSSTDALCAAPERSSAFCMSDHKQLGK